MQHEKSLEFMQIAMKYLPKAKAELEKSGIDLSMEMIQPFMTCLHRSWRKRMSLADLMPGS